MGWKALTATALCGLLLTFGTVQADGTTGDSAAGKTKSSSCAGCHGADGKGKASNPALAGVDEGTLTAKLNGYKSGEIKHMMMNMLAKKLSDEDIANLAAYYSSLPK